MIKLKNIKSLGYFNNYDDDSSSNSSGDLLVIPDSFDFVQRVYGPTHKRAWLGPCLLFMPQHYQNVRGGCIIDGS